MSKRTGRPRKGKYREAAKLMRCKAHWGELPGFGGGLPCRSNFDESANYDPGAANFSSWPR